MVTVSDSQQLLLPPHLPLSSTGNHRNYAVTHTQDAPHYYYYYYYYHYYYYLI
jgi:hypothetical protein